MKIKKFAAAAAAIAVLSIAAPMTGVLPDAVGMTASAEENLTLGDLKFDMLENGTLSVSGLADPGKRKTITDIVIPSEVNGKSVTTIGWDAFGNCISLTSVTIPDSVTDIENSAFRGCTSLTSITIPDGVTSVGVGVFEECASLASIAIPDGVTSIEQSAFQSCTSLKSVTIPNSVTSIKFCAFSGCTSLTSVNIPDSVINFDKTAFSGTTKLTYKQKQYCANDLYYITKNYTYNEDGLCIVDNAVVDCLNDAEQAVIPVGVTSIGENAFMDCASLISVTIPDSVTSVGRSAFMGCAALTSITIPVGVTAISDYTFSGCESLTSITIPAGVTSIETGAFDNCKNLVDITIPNSVTSIIFDTFDESLKNVYYKGSEEQWKKIDCYYPGPGGSHCTLGDEADDMMKLLGAETVQEYLLGKAIVHFNSAVPSETTSGDPNNSGS